ncbi:MAG TPA: hypothetical protein VN812_07105, partial [Candidatus Acidoferrales bacterium]|nr:hypothetical protein [Candidatus Acidoferrales bacterium]
MTVCVAALAAKSQAIVMISDKALTYGPMVSDTSICKMAQIGQSPWHVLMSGNVAIAEEIAMQSALLLKNAPDNGNAGSTMMPLVGMAYRGVYKKHLIENVVTPKAVELTDEEYRECQAFVSAILSPPSPG